MESFGSVRKLLQSSGLGYEEMNGTTPTSSNATQSQCDRIDYTYDVAESVIYAMLFVFGILYTFFGYRFIKPVFFLSGFLTGSILTFVILSEHQVLSLGANIGIALGTGFLLGMLTMLVEYIGLFVSGFHVGISLGIAILLLLEQFYQPTAIWVPLSITCGIGLVVGLLTFRFQKGLIILGTSVFGGALLISCLDYFIEHAVALVYVWERIKGDHSSDICWYSWIILCCWPFCFFVGCVTQWQITGRGLDHKEVMQGKRMKKVNLQKTRERSQKDRSDTSHSRYRHLYKARRVTGDIISQTYLQSVNQELSPSLKRQTIIPPEGTAESPHEPESAHTTLTQIP